MSSDFYFNDELFLTEQDHRRLLERFPKLAFALRTDSLCDGYNHKDGADRAFRSIDEKASQQKSTFRTRGFLAIFLGLCALILAAVEPIIVAPAVEAGFFDEQTAHVLSIAAAVIGICSVLVGWLGMGIADRKHAWLEDRLRAERIRQWHWQYLVHNLPAAARVVATGGAQAAAYVDTRAREYDAFYDDLARNAGDKLNQQLREDVVLNNKLWVAGPGFPVERPREDLLAGLTSGPDQEAASELMEAYRLIRFKAQADYANWSLGKASFKHHPRKQKSVLHGVGLFSVAAIIVFHISIVAGILLHSSDLYATPVYLLIILFALIALAARAIEDGLGPVEQIARMKSYGNEITIALDHFKTGTSQDRLKAMVMMEESAAREMNEFLQSAHHRRYLM